MCWCADEEVRERVQKQSRGTHARHLKRNRSGALGSNNNRGGPSDVLAGGRKSVFLKLLLLLLLLLRPRLPPLPLPRFVSDPRTTTTDVKQQVSTRAIPFRPYQTRPFERADTSPSGDNHPHDQTAITTALRAYAVSRCPFPPPSPPYRIRSTRRLAFRRAFHYVLRSV